MQVIGGGLGRTGDVCQ